MSPLRPSSSSSLIHSPSSPNSDNSSRKPNSKYEVSQIITESGRHILKIKHVHTHTVEQSQSLTQPIQPSHYQDLQEKIKSGNLTVDTFTYLYDRVPQSDKTGTLSRLCSKYIKNLSATTPNTFVDKLKLLKTLPLSLQKSFLILKIIFPRESKLISKIRTGVMPSYDIRSNLVQLLKIVSTKYAYNLLKQYVAENKTLSKESKQHISDCRTFLKEQEHTQSQQTTHKTRKRSQSKSSNALSGEQEPKIKYAHIYTTNQLNSLTQPTKTNYLQNLQDKIKSGNINIVEFTSIYNSIPQSDKTGTLSKLCAKYIAKLSHTIPNTLENNIKLLKSLPVSLQKSSSILNILFPKENEIMAQIRTGLAPSCDLKTNLILLLKIIGHKYAYNLLRQYLSKNKNLSKESNQHIFECRELLKEQKQLQQTTHKASSRKTRKHTSSKSSDSLVKKRPTAPGKNKPDLHPQAELILESLNNCSIKAEDIVASRQQLLLLEVDKGLIKRWFHKFKRKMILSSRPDKQEIIKEIDKSGKKTKLIRSTRQHKNNRLKELLLAVSENTISLQHIKELRRLLFSEHTSSIASSMFYNAKIALIKKRPQNKHEIKQAFSEEIRKKHKESKQSKDLKAAIKAGGLEAQEFTRLYNSITSSREKASVSNIITIYIHGLSQQTLDLQQKISTIKLLPRRLQTSVSTIKSFFPQQHAKMVLIRSGQIKSEELQETCSTLLQIISTQHIFELLSKYVNNKPTITTEEKKHVTECRKILLDIQKKDKDQSDSDIEEMQYDDEPPMPTTSMHTKTLVEYQYEETKQERTTTPFDSSPISQSIKTSTYIQSIVHPYTQSACSEIPVNLLDEATVHTQPTVTEADTTEQPITNIQISTFIDPTSLQQPYPTEIGSKACQPFYIEHMSLDELTCILQGIGNENEGSEDQVILQNYILQLAQELQQESCTVEQSTSNQEEKQLSTSKSSTQTNTIDMHTNEPTYDYEPSQLHEDFIHITDMAKSLNHEDFSQLSNTLEMAIPLREIAPEEFFDFSDIDEK